METGIINKFASFLSWDFFVQGAFMGLCLLVLFFIYNRGLSYAADNTQNLNSIPGYIWELLNFFRLSNTRPISLNLPSSNTWRPPTNPEEKPGENNHLAILFIFRNITFIVSNTILLFIIGLVSNSLSDWWMDMHPCKHAGLKYGWFWTEENDRYTLFETDKRLKHQAFIWVFGDSATTLLGQIVLKNDKYSHHLNLDNYENNDTSFKKVNTSIENIYYYAQHSLFTVPVWNDYVNYSQKIINLSQVFCFGFFILIIGLISYPIYKFLLYICGKCSEEDKQKPTNRNDTSSAKMIKIFFIIKIEQLKLKKTIIWFLHLAIATVGYYLSAYCWYANEDEGNLKTFGSFRVIVLNEEGNTRTNKEKKTIEEHVNKSTDNKTQIEQESFSSEKEDADISFRPWEIRIFSEILKQEEEDRLKYLKYKFQKK